MAISLTNLTVGSTNVDGTAFITGTVTPSANSLELLTVHTITRITSNPVIPTVTGNGLTWGTINSAINDTSGASRRRTTLFRSMGASPTAGAITINYGTQTQTSAAWSLDEASNTDTSGANGAGAVVQSVSLVKIGQTSSLVGTLAAFSSSDNGAYGAFGISYNNLGTVGSGFTGAAVVVDPDGDTKIMTEWRADNDTTVDLTFGGTEDIGVIAIEIKAAVAAAALASYKTLLGVGL